MTPELDLSNYRVTLSYPWFPSPLTLEVLVPCETVDEDNLSSALNLLKVVRGPVLAAWASAFPHRSARPVEVWHLVNTVAELVMDVVCLARVLSENLEQQSQIIQPAPDVAFWRYFT